MHLGPGLSLIALGCLLALLVAFGLWRRLPAAPALGALAACGALVGAGALLVQDRAHAVDWVLTLLALGVMSPLHGRLVLGRPGSAR